MSWLKYAAIVGPLVVCLCGCDFFGTHKGAAQDNKTTRPYSKTEYPPGGGSVITGNSGSLTVKVEDAGAGCTGCTWPPSCKNTNDCSTIPPDGTTFAIFVKGTASAFDTIRMGDGGISMSGRTMCDLH